jgi:acylphosphatase
VKNLPSGEVELYATGDEDAMARFMSDIEKGPSLALVEHIEVRDVAPEPCSGFLIER